MTDDETQSVIDYAQSLWPGWSPDDPDLDAWRNLMGRIRSPDLTRKSLCELKAVTDWRTPKRAQLLDLLKRESGPPTGATLHDGSCGMYVQCVSHPQGGSHVGEFKTLYWRTDREMPGEVVILAAMESLRADQEAMYGGQWQLIRELVGDAVTETQMLQRRFDLRNPPGSPQDARQGPIYQAVGDYIAKQKVKIRGPE